MLKNYKTKTFKDDTNYVCMSYIKISFTADMNILKNLTSVRNPDRTQAVTVRNPDRTQAVTCELFINVIETHVHGFQVTSTFCQLKKPMRWTYDTGLRDYKT